MVPDKLITSYILCGGKNIENVLVFVVMKNNMPALYKKNADHWVPLIPTIFSVSTSLAARLELWTSLILQNFPAGAVKKVPTKQMGSTPHHVGSGQKVPKSTKQNTTQEYPQNAEKLPTRWWVVLVGTYYPRRVFTTWVFFRVWWVLPTYWWVHSHPYLRQLCA